MFRLSIVLLFTLACFPYSANANSTWSIKNSKLLCVTGSELTQLGKMVNGQLVILNFDQKLDKVDRRLLRMEKSMDKLWQTNNYGKLNKIERRYRRLLARFNSMMDCYYEVGDDWDDYPDPGVDPDPGTDPGFGPDPEPTPTPNPGTPDQPANSACSVFTNSKLRIISGHLCSGSSPIVEIMINNQQGCTGTLVTSSLVVTAAHCVADNPSPLSVTAGSESSGVSAYYSHPNYSNNEDHDVAVLLLQNQLSAPTMGILEPDNVPVGSLAAIAGYGEDENKSYGELKAGFIQIGSAGTNSITGHYKGLNNGDDSNTCYGDSGGPLAVNVNGGWYLAGVTSAGSNNSCGVDGNEDYSTFARVSSSSNLSFVKQYM